MNEKQFNKLQLQTIINILSLAKRQNEFTELELLVINNTITKAEIEVKDYE